MFKNIYKKLHKHYTPFETFHGISIWILYARSITSIKTTIIDGQKTIYYYCYIFYYLPMLILHMLCSNYLTVIANLRYRLSFRAYDSWTIPWTKINNSVTLLFNSSKDNVATTNKWLTILLVVKTQIISVY